VVRARVWLPLQPPQRRGVVCGGRGSRAGRLETDAPARLLLDRSARAPLTPPNPPTHPPTNPLSRLPARRYGWHFPEMAKIVQDNLAYSRVVLKMGVRTAAAATDFSDILTPEVRVAGGRSVQQQ
jgi:hypothetical protein